MLLWDKYVLADGLWYYLKAGPLAVWLHRDERRYSCGSRYMGSEENSRDCLFTETSIVPEAVPFSQVVAERASAEVFFRPALPPRPLIVNLGASVRLLPGGEMKIYVSIPLWFQVLVEGNRILFDIPSVVLPGTWFGSLAAGRAAYSLSGAFAWKREEVFPLPNMVVCPLRIRNVARSDFLPSKVAVLSDNLPVYLKTMERGGSDETLLITPEATAEFRGNDEIDLEVSDKVPVEFGGARLLAEPRATGENILKKGLFLLKISSNL